MDVRRVSDGQSRVNFLAERYPSKRQEKEEGSGEKVFLVISSPLSDFQRLSIACKSILSLRSLQRASSSFRLEARRSPKRRSLPVSRAFNARELQPEIKLPVHVLAVPASRERGNFKNFSESGFSEQDGFMVIGRTRRA